MFKQLLKDRSFRLSIILTLIFFSTGIVFLLAGLADLSLILFGLLPVVLGLSIGALPNRRLAYIGAIITTIFFLYGLLTLGLSGFVCIVMALPLVIPLIFIGAVITHLINRYKSIKEDKLPVLVLPLLLFLIAAPADKFLNPESKQIIEVKTEQVFNYTPEQVYDAIKAVDTLDAEKPFLMKFDLPVPYKCILEKEEVGGLRTCYFKQGNFSHGDFGGGTITERITQMERGRILKMDVIGCNIIGRKWLGFKEAVYLFDKVEGGCKLTRITTYTSVLTPRKYWEPLERIGISQEHEYVFNNLKADLERKYGKAIPISTKMKQAP
jgi:hypothetical protein